MAEYRCSFCGKRQDQVRRLIAGGGRPGTFICDECVELCQEIVTEEFLGPTPPRTSVRRVDGPPPPGGDVSPEVAAAGMAARGVG